MIDRVAQTIEKHALLRRGRRVGVAVSGGADSVFLLHALRELGLAALVLHVNHKLRGAESDADERFVRDLAAGLGLPLAVAVAPPASGNVEQEARRARYAFFAQHVADGAVATVDAVATGHTLDDQAETVLYRLLRGSGTTGLSGIHVSTPSGLIRPLIELRRAEIREWLKDRNIPWREDLSNQDFDYARNRLRLEIIPQLAALNPAVSDVLAQTASWAAGEEEYWNAEIERLAPTSLDRSRPETILIDTSPFIALPLAVQRRLLRYGILQIRGSLRSIDFRHVEAIRALMATREGSGRLQIPGLDVYRSFDRLRLAPLGYDSRLARDFEVPLAIPGITTVPDRPIAIETEQITFSGVYNKELVRPACDCFDPDRCSGPFVLRNWRPGDRYQARGRPGVEKIKTLFQEFRVPLWERRSWPVIVQTGAWTGAGAAGDIVWSRRFGVAGEFAAGPQSRRGVKIRERKESNPAPGASIE